MDAWVARMCNVPVIIGHSHNTSCNVLWQHYMFRPFVNYFLTDRFACSKEAGKWGVGEKRNVEIIHNAVDIDQFYFNVAVRQQYRGELHL